MNFKNAFTPPTGGKIIKIASFALALLTLLFAAIFSIVNTQLLPHASAATTILMKDLPNGAPKQGIIVDDLAKFYTIKPIFTTTNTDFVKYDGRPWGNNQGLDNPDWGFSVKYNKTFSNTQTVPGNFSLRWNNIATDASGNAVDIVMKISNVQIYGSPTNPPCLLSVYSSGYIFAEAVSTKTDGIYSQFDIEYFFYLHGTDTPSPHSAVMEFTDLDAYPSKNPSWAESIRLLANYDTNVHILPDNTVLPNSGNPNRPGCWLNITDLAGTPTFSATSGGNDNDTMHTGLCVTGRNGFKFSWWGYGCTTGINSFYGSHTITASADKGGTITNPGPSLVGWKNDKTYTITPDRGYKVKDVLVDGKSVGAVTEYIFTEVIADHTIHATFEPCQVNLFYDKNADDATGETPSSQHDAYSTCPAEEGSYTREGYRFAGWNTQPDGSGTSILPGAEIVFEDKDITLYAQWEKLQFAITWIDELTGETFSTETVPWGEDASMVESFPTHIGYSPDSSAITLDMLLNVREDREIRVPYVKNKYTLDVKFLNKHYRTEIQDAIHGRSIEYEAPYAINSYISDMYIFEPELIEIRDADTREPLDISNLIEIDADGQVTLKSMPAQNLEITLLYDTWIEMPETGSANGLLMGFIGVFIMMMGLVLITIHKK